MSLAPKLKGRDGLVEMRFGFGWKSGDGVLGIQEVREQVLRFPERIFFCSGEEEKKIREKYPELLGNICVVSGVKGIRRLIPPVEITENGKKTILRKVSKKAVKCRECGREIRWGLTEKGTWVAYEWNTKRQYHQKHHWTCG